MKKMIGVICLIPFLLWAGVRIWNSIIFNIECGGYMQNAASANSIDLAKKEMEKVVGYIESRHLQPGFTSVIYNTPDEDVGFWMSNMRSSLDELKQIKPNATSLEKSNVLIKLRETVTHKTKESAEVTVPEGITVYPHNATFMLWGYLSFIFGVAGVFVFMVGLEND